MRYPAEPPRDTLVQCGLQKRWIVTLDGGVWGFSPKKILKILSSKEAFSRHLSKNSTLKKLNTFFSGLSKNPNSTTELKIAQKRYCASLGHPCPVDSHPGPGWALPIDSPLSHSYGLEWAVWACPARPCSNCVASPAKSGRLPRLGQDQEDCSNLGVGKLDVPVRQISRSPPMPIVQNFSFPPTRIRKTFGSPPSTCNNLNKGVRIGIYQCL